MASNEQVKFVTGSNDFFYVSDKFLLEVITMMMMTMMIMMITIIIVIIMTIITTAITITIYSSIKREEKLLRHVAMVAKILDDNKPKASLKK